VVAEWDARRRVLRVWDSTQAPLPIKNGLAGLFGLPEFNVEVVAPTWAAASERRSCSFIRRKFSSPSGDHARTPGEMDGGPPRAPHRRHQERGQIHDVEVGFDETGRILALRDHFVHDTGAYTPYGIVVPIITSTQLPGPTVCRTIRSTSRSPIPTRQRSPRTRGGAPHGAFVMGARSA